MLSLRIPSPPLSSSQPSNTSNNGCTTFTTRTSTTSRRSRRSCGWLACKGGEKETTKFEVDNKRALEALEKLDKELQTLSNNQTLQSNMEDKKKTPYPPKATYNASDVNMTTEEMPEFSESFLVYSAVVLLAITFLYNMFFILVIKPAVDVV